MSARLLYTGIVRKFAGIGAGEGYIAGTTPYGLLTVASMPSAQRISVADRKTGRPRISILSGQDGTYHIAGLSPLTEFDLIARDWTGVYNDTIVSRIRPEPYDVTTLTDEIAANSGTGALDGFVRVYGGMPGHTVAVSAGTAPPGITFAVNIIQDNDGAATFAVVPSGSTTPGTYTWTLTITAPNGSAKSIELTKTWA